MPDNFNAVFMVFEEITAENIAAITKAYAFKSDRICDNTPMDLFAWKDFFRSKAAVSDGFIITEKIFPDKKRFGVAGDLSKALTALKKYCAEKGDEFALCYLTDEQIETALSYFESPEIKKMAGFGDYVYDYQALATLKGKHLNGQRNHVNKFKKSYDFRFEKLCAENLTDAARFFESFKAEHLLAASGFEEYELTASELLLKSLGLFDFVGGILYAEGKVAAITVGEIIGDTLYTHIEKADRTFEGCYAAINYLFAASLADGNLKYVNREEDMNDEGLRKAKLSYHPAFIAEKFVIDEA